MPHAESQLGLLGSALLAGRLLPDPIRSNTSQTLAGAPKKMCRNENAAASTGFGRRPRSNACYARRLYTSLVKVCAAHITSSPSRVGEQEGRGSRAGSAARWYWGTVAWTVDEEPIL